jgi:hypothetical protein
MVWTKYSLPVGKQRFEGGCCCGGVPGLTTPPGEVMAREQRVGMVWTKYSHPVGEQRFEGGHRSGGVSSLTTPAGKVATTR